MILRVAETYKVRVSIYDQHGILDDVERVGTIRDFACGAMERRGLQKLEDDLEIERLLLGKRLVATSIDPRSCALPDYKFYRGDLFALGNEYEGLPDALIARADAVLHVPMPAGWTPKPKAHNPIDPRRIAPVAHDGQPNLNVAMTAGIVCYAAFISALAGANRSPSVPDAVDKDGGSSR